MRRAHAEASALIDAPAAEIYAVLTDYGNAHPHILPKPYFTKLAVEQGGIGAGTISVNLSILYESNSLR